MANPRNESKTLGGSDHEDNLVTGAEFKIFQHETQQTLRDIQAALVRVTTGNNQGINNPPGHQHHRERSETCERPPGILRRQPVYEDILSEDEEEAEAILRGNRRGYQREPDQHMFRMKMDLPSFNGQLQIKGLLDWLVLVERFFDYMDIPEDKKVKLVAYRLLGGASAWWEQLKSTRLRQ
jgi:hypothetical protein